jgi:hypothetical protein
MVQDPVTPLIKHRASLRLSVQFDRPAGEFDQPGGKTGMLERPHGPLKGSLSSNRDFRWSSDDKAFLLVSTEEQRGLGRAAGV